MDKKTLFLPPKGVKPLQKKDRWVINGLENLKDSNVKSFRFRSILFLWFLLNSKIYIWSKSHDSHAFFWYAWFSFFIVLVPRRTFHLINSLTVTYTCLFVLRWVASYTSMPNTSPTGKDLSDILTWSFGQTSSSQVLFNNLGVETLYNPVLTVYYLIRTISFFSFKKSLFAIPFSVI